MSLAEIEAALENLTADELRRLALKSWKILLEKGVPGALDECSEDDPHLLAALDEALAQADMKVGQGHSAGEVRARLAKWTSR